MNKAASGTDARTFDKGDESYKSHRNQQHLLNRETGKGIHFSGGKSMPQGEAAAGQTPAVSPVVLVLPRSNELKLDLDRFLPDEGIMRVRIRAGRSTMNPDEYASLRLLFSAHTSNNANFSQTISDRDIPVTASADDPQFIHFDIPLSDIQRNPFRKLDTTFPSAMSSCTSTMSRTHRAGKNLSTFSSTPSKSLLRFTSSGRQKLTLTSSWKVLTGGRGNLWPRGAESISETCLASSCHLAGGRSVHGSVREVSAGICDVRRGHGGSARDRWPLPEFLYLTQRVPADESLSSARISELELASRLSMFLWSSIPDDELLKLAEQGKLREPEVLTAQVNRLLADPRSRRFSQNFVEQWLGLDRMNSVTHVTDGSLKEAMLEEPVAFFDEVLKHNHSIMDFVHSDYAIVNERLAAHYQIAQVYGPHFRRVPITPQMNRGGLLTSAAIMTMNSDGKDSHPLKRGVWMLKRILDDPPPPPPPNVPEVDLTDPEILKMTLKERIANHRDKPACISCHSRIDPWGIAFENFDALGAYRTHIKNEPVDATSELFNRQTLAGVDGLKRYLLRERQDQFAEAMVHKLTAFALGRPLSFGDSADIDSLTAQFRQRDDGLGDLIQLIVSSKLFNTK